MDNLDSERLYAGNIWLVGITIFIVISITNVSLGLSDELKTGIFVICPISGISYRSGQLIGSTDSSGGFNYYDGQTITFYIGNIIIGQTIAKQMITPIDLVEGADDENHPYVINICRFLQSLDTNQRLDDGIYINYNVIQSIENLYINFYQSTESFENDPQVIGLFEKLNSLHYYGWNSVGNLIPAELAKNNFKATITNWGKEKYSIETDLEAGFPIAFLLPHVSGASYRAGPVIHNLVGNIDEDSQKEILVSGLSLGPLFGIKPDLSDVIIYGEPKGVAYPALGKINNNGFGLDVVYTTFSGYIAAFEGNGSIIPGWPKESHNYCTTPPVLADLNNDGLDEIIVSEENGCLYVYKGDGSELQGWPFCQDIAPGVTQDFSIPAIGDIDKDGEPEIIISSGESSSPDNPKIYAINSDGTLLSGFPTVFQGNVHSFPVLGDVDGDGEIEIVVGGYYDDSYEDGGDAIIIISPSGDIENKIRLRYYHVTYGTTPVLADLDGDKTPEIIYQTDAYLLVYRHDINGFSLFPGWPQRVSDSPDLDNGNSSPAVGDVDGDGFQEIVITVRTSFSGQGIDEIRVYETNGTLNPKFPKIGSLEDGGTPAISDIDGDGRNEIIIRGDNSELFWHPAVYVYDLGGEKHGVIEWGQLGRDCRHTNLYIQSDHDGDNLTDNQEAMLGTDPYDMDSDDDGMPDGWEVQYDLDPLVNDASLDPDKDGYTNLQEYKEGGDPYNSATPFPWELFYPAFIGR